MFDSFNQQHLFHMTPNNSCTISKIPAWPTKAHEDKKKGNLHQIQVQFGLGFQPAHQLVFSA